MIDLGCFALAVAGIIATLRIAFGGRRGSRVDCKEKDVMLCRRILLLPRESPLDQNNALAYGGAKLLGDRQTNLIVVCNDDAHVGVVTRRMLFGVSVTVMAVVAPQRSLR